MANQRNLEVDKIGLYLKRHLATDADQPGGSPSARAVHGVAPRIRRRRRIERFVGALSMRQLLDRLDSVIHRRIDCYIRALLHRDLTPASGNVDCNHASTHRRRQLRAR